MMVQMNVEKYLSQKGIHDISVAHCSLSEAVAYCADLFVIGLDIAPQMKQMPRVIVMQEIISMDELSKKMDVVLTSEEDTIWVE